MRHSLIYLLSLFLVFLSCSKKQEVTPTIENCQSLLDAKVLTLEERANTCIYIDVFSYQGNLYTICECCVCDKVYQALDCNGEDLFKTSPNVIQDFQKNAEYLFSVEEN